jgi:putative ABC transport system permease protein
VSYRDVSRFELKNPAAFYPIGTFTASDLIPNSPDEGRVSLGVYDVPPVEIVSSPIAVAGTTLLPTLNPAGLVARPPAAIADIRDAELLRGATPIDAIRVRVAGVDVVTADTQHRVEQVAGEIASLGLSVRVVIGSSPQEVKIDVPEYVTSGHDVSNLGTVTQRWTTMGAATTVAQALSQATISLAVLAALAALTAAMSAQLLESASARRDAAILRISGWPRRRIRRRLAAAPLLASGVALVAAGVVWGVNTRDLIMGVVALALCLLSPLATVLGVRIATQGSAMGAAKSGDTTGIRSRSTVSSRLSLAGRLVTSTPIRSAALAVLIVVASTATGLAVAIFVSRAVAAGPTLLASSLVSSLSGWHLSLLAASVVTSIVFAVLLWRYLLASRALGDRSLRASGWRPVDLRRLRLETLGWIALPAVVLGTAASALLSFELSEPLPGIAAMAASLAGLIVVGTMAVTSHLGRVATS